MEKIWHVRKKQWVEEQNGDHERRNSEEDVGDLLLGVGEVLWEFSHSKKGKRERQRRRRSSSRTGTKLVLELLRPLKAMRRLKLAAEKGNHRRRGGTGTAGLQDGCIRKKGAAPRNRVGRKLAENY